MVRILFVKKLPSEIWKNIRYESRETFQKYLKVNLLNQIHNVMIIKNKDCYELT